MFFLLFSCHAQTAIQQAPPTRLPQKLTFGSALEILKTNGIDLLIADAQVAQAAGDLSASKVMAKPQLGFAFGKSPGFKDRLYGASISDNSAFSDLISGRRGLRVDIAKLALRSSNHERDDVYRVLGVQLKTQFMQVLLAKRYIDLTTQAKEVTAKTSGLVKKRLEAGTASEVDLARAEVVALELEQALDAAMQHLKEAKAELAYMLGERGVIPDFECIGDEFFLHVMPEELATATPESLLNIALQHRPDIKIAETNQLKSQLNFSLAKREWIPDASWSFGVMKQGIGENAIQPKTWTVDLAITLPSIKGVKGEMTRAKAELLEQYLQKRKTESQIALDISTGWAMFSTAKTRLDRMENRILALSKKAYDLVLFQYERGAASLLDVLDAQRTWIETNTEHLQALCDYWTGLMQLEQAIGKDQK
jgi:cobalt-zinc-cadmium efflux system outer membrane protein